MQKGIVPGVARGHSAPPVGTLGIDLLELGVDPRGFPTQTEGHVNGMHPEVAHHADLSARGDLAFPIRRLVRIEVAGMMKARTHLQQLAECAGLRRLPGPLHARERREIRTASHEAP